MLQPYNHLPYTQWVLWSFLACKKAKKLRVLKLNSVCVSHLQLLYGVTMPLIVLVQIFPYPYIYIYCKPVLLRPPVGQWYVSSEVIIQMCNYFVSCPPGGILTGNYGMWNAYCLIMLYIYAPAVSRTSEGKRPSGSHAAVPTDHTSLQEFIVKKSQS